MHFFVPNVTESKLRKLIKADIDVSYPYWLGGPINWLVQTYLVLRQYREHLSIDTTPSPREVNIGHVLGWRQLGLRGGEYRVSIRADYRRLFDVDFEILQNPVAKRSARQVYLTYWPLPGLLARDPARKVVENVAYAGRTGNRNIASSLKQPGKGGEWHGLRFRIIEKKQWHDMQSIDILLAVRDFSTRTYDEKPPSKLLNAWQAGIPLIAGYDSAYSSIGTPGLDYIRVKTEGELRDALERLRDDPHFYSQIVKAGHIKVREYTREKIAQKWFLALDGPIRCDWEQFFADGSRRRLLSLRKRWIDRTLDTASQLKIRV